MGLIIYLMCNMVSPQAYADFREIRIGATVSASGKFATEVGPFKKLLTEWTEKINRQGGLPLTKKQHPSPG